MKIEPYYADNHVEIFNKDCRAMDELEDATVQCVPTSPPYWGLRKYSGEQELVWGDNNCEHQWGELLPCHHPGQVTDAKAVHNETTEGQTAPSGQFCSLCGAWKGAYGLEPTPEMYIEHTIEILREIRRVLRKDGVVFWNIGDSYWGGKGQSGQQTPEYQLSRFGSGKSINRIQLGGPKITMPKDGKHSSIKPKDLCLIPFRLAIACQEDGWWVRSVIIWSKPNPMPESVTDRPTESHEYILMLTKSGTTQYWTHRDHAGSRTQPRPDYRWVKRGKPDMKAIAKEIGGMSQRTVWEERDGEDRGWREAAERQHSDIVEERDTPPEGWTPKNKMGWDRINLWQGHDYYWDADAVREPHKPESFERYKYEFRESDRDRLGHSHHGKGYQRTNGEVGNFNPAGRNIRTVWEFPTQPYPEAHFAVFPEKLPEICIKAATPEVGCCSKCGAPWERIVQKQQPFDSGRIEQPRNLGSQQRKSLPSKMRDENKAGFASAKIETLGWQPTCKCNADKVPSLVLDPFLGAGTVAWVAKKLNRQCVGYEISEEYCRLAVERCRQQALGLTKDAQM